MAIRRQIAGSLNDAGDQSRFGRSDIFQVFVEIGLRCLRKSTDGERAALAQIHPIGIKLEDLLLAELLLHLQRNQHFRELALDRLLVMPGLLRSDEEGPGKLHGDGRAALLVALMSYVHPGGFRQADKVHAAVLEESAVFDGQHRIDHQLGNLVIGDQLPLGTLFGIEQGSDHLRFEFVGRKIAGLAA